MRRTKKIAIGLTVLAAFLGAAVAVAFIISTLIKQSHEIDNMRQERTSYATDVIALRAQIASIGQEPVVGPPNPAALDTKGDKGDKGEQGSMGPQGIPGITGAAGATGAPGPPGPRGDKGEPGVAGPVGATGSQGPQGNTGATGATGPAGVDGAPGPTGPAGADGATGPPGAQGPPGADGSMPDTWSYTFAGITVNCVRDSPSHYACT